MSIKLSRDEIKRLGLDVPRRRNKFGAVRTEHDGFWYDSKAEAGHAARLDVLKVHGHLKWIPQVTFRLGPDHKYRADFLVLPKGKPPEVHEVKGKRTARFNETVKLWTKYGMFPLLIFHNGRLEETIIPKDYIP